MGVLKDMHLFLIPVMLVSGCAGHTKELLSQDHLHMTNDQLLLIN